jgi:hypothetical protein
VEFSLSLLQCWIVVERHLFQLFQRQCSPGSSMTLGAPPFGGFRRFLRLRLR